MIKVGLDSVVRVLIASDFFFNLAWGLVAPIFAIFILEEQAGGDSLAIVGFVVATYWVTKSIAQLFIGYYLDINKGERDDFKFLIYGMYIANLVPLAYIFVNSVVYIFLLEFIRGLAMAAVIPSLRAIFARHISKGWEAFSWGMQSSVSIGLASGLAAAFGGILVTVFGFKVVFLIVSILGLLASTLLLKIKNHIFINQNE